MTRRIARPTPPPFGRRSHPTGHREAPVRPCATALTLGAARALGWALALLTLRADPVGAAEVARDRPAAGAPFVETGPDPLAGPGDDPSRPADLSLVWYDRSGGLAGGGPALADEVRSIFRALGVEVSWRVEGTFGAAEIPEVPVILLAVDPAKARRKERILGLVIPDQEPQRAVWAFLETLRLTLGVGPDPLDPQQARALGRALGRVVAHEVIHAIAPNTPHAGEGLMRHALSKRFLLGTEATVDAGCASAFLARLSAEGQQARARSAAFNTLP